MLIERICFVNEGKRRRLKPLIIIYNMFHMLLNRVYYVEGEK